jgi:hypothetical protein
MRINNLPAVLCLIWEEGFFMDFRILIMVLICHILRFLTSFVLSRLLCRAVIDATAIVIFGICVLGAIDAMLFVLISVYSKRLPLILT